LQEAAAVQHTQIEQQQRRQLKTTAASTTPYLHLQEVEDAFNTEGFELSLEAFNKSFRELLSRQDRKQAAARRKLAEDLGESEMRNVVQVSADNTYIVPDAVGSLAGA
jgi:hypothetical protein